MREKPLEWGPLAARAIRASPSPTLLPSMISAFFHHADAETGDVVIFPFIHARHFGSFTADQGTAGLFAAGADAGDHGSGSVHVQFAGGIVVEEEGASAPCTMRSLTHMATKSIPTVSCFFRSMARRSLVPTPSVPETSTGSL